ncbi:MAG: hypothetical protein LBJ67_10745 [Planctomycetaceae bacterium]|jgi:hypothetical protein|nr:hypothetical protein [Planctomycetaceae bacterium]
MARTFARKPTPPKDCTVRLSMTQDLYPHILDDSTLFREWITEQFALHPELFPDNFVEGYCMKGTRTSSKLKIDYRRITLRDGRICAIYLLISHFGKRSIYKISELFNCPSQINPHGNCIVTRTVLYDTRQLNDNARRPAERLNQKRYAENWLDNLFIATANQLSQNAK